VPSRPVPLFGRLRIEREGVFSPWGSFFPPPPQLKGEEKERRWWMAVVAPLLGFPPFSSGKPHIFPFCKPPKEGRECAVHGRARDYFPLFLEEVSFLFSFLKSEGLEQLHYGSVGCEHPAYDGFLAASGACFPFLFPPSLSFLGEVFFFPSSSFSLSIATAKGLEGEAIRIPETPFSFYFSLFFPSFPARCGALFLPPPPLLGFRDVWLPCFTKISSQDRKLTRGRRSMISNPGGLLFSLPFFFLWREFFFFFFFPLPPPLY